MLVVALALVACAACSADRPPSDSLAGPVASQTTALRFCPPPPVCPAPPDAAVCAPPVVCPTAPPPVVCPAPIPGSVVGWVPCAIQGENCVLPPGAVKVRYGGAPEDGGGNLDLPFAAGSSVHCDIDTFGQEAQRLFHTWSPNLCPWCTNYCWYEGSFLPVTPSRPVIGPAIALPLPIAYPGSSQPRVRPTDDVPNPQTGESNTVGAFRVSCRFSNFSFADPISHEGYLSNFFGNTSVIDASTATSIGNSGYSTCDGGTLNRSAYWMPAMIDTRTGKPVRPESNNVYYKTGYNGIAAADVQAVPPGLVMVQGSPDNIVPGGNPTTRYACLGDPHQAWSLNIPTSCIAGGDLLMAVEFPQCWDGVNLDSFDHRSHMSFTVNGACPASHPKAIPVVAYNGHWKITEADATAFYVLSSDNYDTSGGRAGYNW